MITIIRACVPQLPRMKTGMDKGNFKRARAQFKQAFQATSHHDAGKQEMERYYFKRWLKISTFLFISSLAQSSLLNGTAVLHNMNHLAYDTSGGSGVVVVPERPGKDVFWAYLMHPPCPSVLLISLLPTTKHALSPHLLFCIISD